MMLRFLLLLCCCLLGSRAGYAQDQDRQFIKLEHIGAEDKPILGAFICTQPSEMDEKLALAPGYRAETVYLIGKAEFNALLKFAGTYAASISNTASISPATTAVRRDYGAFQLSVNDGKSALARIVMPKDEALVFITELTVIMDEFAAANRKDPALWDALKDTATRLAY
jgi:hypothetical protein